MRSGTMEFQIVLRPTYGNSRVTNFAGCVPMLVMVWE